MTLTTRTLLLSTLCGVIALGCAIKSAEAAVIPTDVSTFVVLNNNAGSKPFPLAFGDAPLWTFSNEMGADIGNFLGNAPVWADYRVSSPAPHVYDVTVRVGSREPGMGPVAIPTLYAEPIVANGDVLPPPNAVDDVINQATVSFGVGTGIAFDDFGPASRIVLMDDLGAAIKIGGLPIPRTDFVNAKADPQPGSAFINPDGTLGFQMTFDADNLKATNPPLPLSPAMNGNLVGSGLINNIGVDFTVNGFSLAYRVKVVPEPTSAMLASLAGFAGLACVRRRK